ncbi:hypothetical protein BLOT_014217 [Blomia tropicalis]|nr:hypothetical protein BLOT_014217 [Blomia tropicalis]
MQSTNAMIYFVLVLLFINLNVSVAIRSVTYNGIGTFTWNFYDPVYRPSAFLMLPQNPDKIDPSFHLFTRNNTEQYDVLDYKEQDSISHSHFNSSLPTKVVIHGFRDGEQIGYRWMKKMSDRMLERENVNVILVDWYAGSFGMYGQAMVNTQIVGAMLGNLISMLANSFGANNFHLIGDCLGVYVAGIATIFLGGKSSLVNRITSLDGSGPIYTLPGYNLLSNQPFIDAIHSDPSFFTYQQTCGTIDFWPLLQRTTMNNVRARDMYIDSLKKDIPQPKTFECENESAFKQGKCTDCGSNGEKCALLGPNAIDYRKFVDEISDENQKRKRFFMITNSVEPYLSKYQYIIKIKNNNLNWLSIFSIDSIKFYDSNGKVDHLILNTWMGLSNIPCVLSIMPNNLKKIKLIQNPHRYWMNLGKRIDVCVIDLTYPNMGMEGPSNVIKFCLSNDDGDMQTVQSI